MANAAVQKTKETIARRTHPKSSEMHKGATVNNPSLADYVIARPADLGVEHV
jgi:hypothetical protein